MIGIVASEDWTAIELQPRYAKRCPKWLALVLPLSLPDKMQGEWGIAFSGFRCLVLFKGNEQHFYRKR